MGFIDSSIALFYRKCKILGHTLSYYCFLHKSMNLPVSNGSKRTGFWFRYLPSRPSAQYSVRLGIPWHRHTAGEYIVGRGDRVVSSRGT